MGPQIETVLGYPADSWQDFSVWASRIHSEDRESSVEYCSVLTSRGYDHDFIYRAIHQDGSIRWIHDIVSVSKVKDDV